MNKISAFTQEDMKAFEPTMKIGLLATITEEGLPHITMLSSLKASSPTEVIWGQFTEGLAYNYVLKNPNTAFLIMNLNKEFWRGTAAYTHARKEGKDFEFYNNTDMFRYNAYFGVHTVHYLDLKEAEKKQALPMTSIVFTAIKTLIAKTFGKKQSEHQPLDMWSRALMDKVGNLKFISWVRDDGFPVIVPIIQAATLDPEHVIFSTGVFRDELNQLKPGQPAAVFGLSLDMTDILMRGVYLGEETISGVKCGKVKVDWVYSPMPPNPQQIYPRPKLEAVREF